MSAELILPSFVSLDILLHDPRYRIDVECITGEMGGVTGNYCQRTTRANFYRQSKSWKFPWASQTPLKRALLLGLQRGVYSILRHPESAVQVFP